MQKEPLRSKASDEKYKCINEINGAEDLEDLENNTRIYINRDLQQICLHLG